MTPGQVSTVWQYYRNVSFSINGQLNPAQNPYNIITVSPGQHSFATTPLNQDVYFPPGESESSIGAFNLTWRMVSIELTPEAAAKRATQY